jgi:hypothetical protein
VFKLYSARTKKRRSGSSTLGFVLGNKGIFGLWSLIGRKEIGNEGK